MSNKAVPTIYRSIISEVIEAVRTDFDEVGVEEAVLQELLRSWEDKVAHSRVADFANDPRIGQEARKHPPLPTQQAVNLAHAASANGASSAKVKKDSADKPKVGDGDEINSDLDDSDDDNEAEDDEAGAESGDLVIALYEKVQRTKNKWKVTLKDGLVSVGGKEYLFAKCQGEFEW